MRKEESVNEKVAGLRGCDYVTIFILIVMASSVALNYFFLAKRFSGNHQPSCGQLSMYKHTYKLNLSAPDSNQLIIVVGAPVPQRLRLRSSLLASRSPPQQTGKENVKNGNS